MSDKAVLLTKWFTHEVITLIKGQLGHSHTKRNIPILIFSPVENFEQQSLVAKLSTSNLFCINYITNKSLETDKFTYETFS